MQNLSSHKLCKTYQISDLHTLHGNIAKHIISHCQGFYIKRVHSRYKVKCIFIIPALTYNFAKYQNSCILAWMIVITICSCSKIHLLIYKARDASVIFTDARIWLLINHLTYILKKTNIEDRNDNLYFIFYCWRHTSYIIPISHQRTRYVSFTNISVIILRKLVPVIKRITLFCKVYF